MRNDQFRHASFRPARLGFFLGSILIFTACVPDGAPNRSVLESDPKATPSTSEPGANVIKYEAPEATAMDLTRNAAPRGRPIIGENDDHRRDAGSPEDPFPTDGGSGEQTDPPADAAAPRSDAAAPRADAAAPRADAAAPRADAGTTPRPDAAVRDAASPDARARDAAVVNPGDCQSAGPIDMNGSTGPINLIEVQGHGLPGCYRCGVAAADFDGDGRIDIVMAGAFDSAFTPDMRNYTFQNRIRVFRNVSCPGGEIRFEEVLQVPNASGGGGALVVVGDFNGDHVPDFAVQFREGNSPESDTSAFMNTGGFNFTRRPLGHFNTRSTSLGMAVADIDRDGKDDLVLNSDAYGAAPGLWYRWNGSAFEARQTDFPHTITYGGTIAAGDLDGDGYPDIAVGGNASRPFGSYDCSTELQYGEIHYNHGDVGTPGIEMDGNRLGQFAMRADRRALRCTGMDNASMLIADMDNDGHPDIVIAGSADAFQGPPPGPPVMNKSHYGFIVLFNRDGTGRNFVAWEAPGIQYPDGTTNGGAGNVDAPNIAVGDLDGDGLPETFIQGHKRDYATAPGRYIFDSKLFHNVAGQSFDEVTLSLPAVGEGGQVMADFNNDGKIDLIFTGASIPFHTNGSNPQDHNNAGTLSCYVYRNTRR